MALLIPLSQLVQHDLATPISIVQFQIYCLGFVEFIDKGELVYVVNEAAWWMPGLLNRMASEHYGGFLYGDVVICNPSEIE